MPKHELDIDMATAAEETIAAELEHALYLKGYCVIGLGVDDETQYDALDDIKALRVDSRFEPPPKEIVEGLLGDQGSGEMTQLKLPEDEDYADSEKLRAVDTSLSSVAASCGRFMESLGFASTLRSRTVVLRGGEADYDGPDMTEEMCSEWISTFNQGKLMLVYSLGPNDSTLELQPFDDEAGTVEVSLAPDTLVILRCDMLAHKHQSTAIDYTLCCWVTTPETMTGPRGWVSTNVTAAKVMPVAKELDEWARDRMQTIFGMELDGTLEEGSVPRDWMRMVHHQFFVRTQNPVAVRGEATHAPSTYNNEVLWKTMNNGMDLLSEIPLQRWDHSEWYDPDPNAWMQSQTFRPYAFSKTAVRHQSFIDGIALFDNKFFGMSVMESSGMDPMQRHILETSYECLFHAGYKKKDLMNSYIAVFTGCTNPEWNYIDRDAGACSGTGSSQAITSNRTSFILGMMGPSTSIDCEMASAAMALMVGSTAVAPNNDRRTSTGGDSDAACCGGVFFSMSPFMWCRFGSFMNPHGRCFTFDQSANGYVRGEMCGSMALKPYAEKVDGNLVVPENVDCLGTIVGWRMTNNGRAASLTAPCGPAEQEACADAVKHAGIHVLDMDGMDCHGVGGLLADAVEVSSVTAVLRGVEGGEKEPLLLGSAKSHVGAMCEASGMCQFAKVLYNIMYGTNTPSLHMKQLNPHIELNDGAVQMNSEHTAYRDRSAFHGIASRGWGGTNVNLIMWYSADEARVVLDKPELDHQDFNFWPGGGGILARDARPSEGYFIVGSWNVSGQPEEMAKTEEGCFSYTVTLGINNFETFQIWLDGENDRVLHPSMPRAPPGSAVMGPSELPMAEGLQWMIDGREMTYSPMALSLTDGEGEEGAAPRSTEIFTYPTRDKGKPGDQYEVSLLTAGKYRAVTWKKVKSDTEIDAALLAGSYYIVGSWNDWTFVEMEPSAETPGLFTAEVQLRRPGGEFQIFRNKDWDQMFYPATSTGGSSDEVLGPEAVAGAATWRLKGSTGDVFKVEFQRRLEAGKDVRKISWILERKQLGF